MKKAKRTSQQKKALSQKIAEIIWESIGGIIMAAGFISCILGTFIANMTGNFEHHPFYPLYQFQDKFFAWLEKWSKIKMDSFLFLGFALILFSCVYLLIVLFIYANKKDALDKKEKARKLREKNLRKFEEERKAIEESEKQEQETSANANDALQAQ